MTMAVKAPTTIAYRSNMLLLLISVASFAINNLVVQADVVLDKKIVDLALIGAELSSLAYEEDPPADGYDDFGFYDAEPDQAIIAKRDGYCFTAFRGTTMTWEDWKQNFEMGLLEVCGERGSGKHECCKTRSGFSKAYNTPYAGRLETAVRNCAKTCSNPDECVVFTGHSQGGAIAAVAGVKMADLNPYVITFGQPATLEANCPLVSSARWYRFVNTKDTPDTGLTYDPIPFAPGFGTGFYGHMIILSQDTTGVAYIGLDSQDVFGPLDAAGADAHSMVAPEGGVYPGYTDRLKAIVANATTLPLRATGFSDGSLCTKSSECMSGKCAKETTFSFSRCVGKECVSDQDCPTGRCDSGSCIPQLGSCMACDEDSDCAGGKCLLFKCSGENGLMDDNCICKWDDDCDSGRCELLETGNCEAQLPLGATCNEDSDCLSDYCSWRFECAVKLPGGSGCLRGADCESGSCTWLFKCASGSSKSSSSSSAVSSAKAMAAPDAEMFGSESSSNFSMFHALKVFWIAGLCAVVVNTAYKSYGRYRRGYTEVGTVTEMSV